jgi:hydroxymethylglutaryl-CoA lyase
MRSDMYGQLPEKVEMVELFARDGLQNEAKTLPTEAKFWFIDQFVRANYTTVEVTNFTVPRFLPQFKDAEELLKKVHEIPKVKEGKVHLKCYGMTVRAFERAAEVAQKGYGPSSMAFTVSAEDRHGMWNSSRTRAEYAKDWSEMVRLGKENGFAVDMAIAATYGSPMIGSVPISHTIELIEQGLDLGIRRFTPCDTTGETNPRTAYEYMAALVDKFGKYDNEVRFRICHFHNTRGLGLANTVGAIMGGGRIIETSLGQLGGQPAFIVDGVPGCGTGALYKDWPDEAGSLYKDYPDLETKRTDVTGPLYTDSNLVGNSSTEDTLVMLDEMGIDVGVDIDRMLGLGRVLEWVLERNLLPYCTKAGRVPKQPVRWNWKPTLTYVAPYNTAYWAYPKA